MPSRLMRRFGSGNSLRFRVCMFVAIASLPLVQNMALIPARGRSVQLGSKYARNSGPSACALHTSAPDEDIVFVTEAIALIRDVAASFEGQVHILAFGASALNMLRVGSVAINWDGVHYYNDGDVDLLAIYPNETVKLQFWSSLAKESESSLILNCPYNHCIPRQNMTKPLVTKLMPCASNHEGQPQGCKKAFYEGHGSFKVTIDTAYAHNHTHFAHYLSGRVEPRYIPNSRVFPAKLVKLYNTSVFVANDYMWMFSSTVPYVDEEKWLGFSPEYGRGCFGMAYSAAYIRFFFGNTWTFDDLQLDRLRYFERSLVQCAAWLENQGFASFSECF